MVSTSLARRSIALTRSRVVVLPGARSIARQNLQANHAKPRSGALKTGLSSNGRRASYSARSYRVMAAAGDSLYSGFSAKDIDGNVCDLGSFAGKVALVVNVASK